MSDIQVNLKKRKHSVQMVSVYLPADLRNAVIMGHHSHDVVQRQERIALDFCVDVFPLGACRQQLHKGDVVGQGAALIPSGSLGAHHVEEDGK